MASTVAAANGLVQTVRQQTTRRVNARRAGVVVRAQLSKKDRSKDVLHFASDQSLSYLDGSLPGDFGFDPFGLMDPESKGVGFVTPSWLAYAEIINGRWAMLGAAGMLAPEVLGAAGLIPESTRIAWFESGVFPPAGTYEYWTDTTTLFFGQSVLIQFAELRRLQDYRKPGSQANEYFLGIEKAFAGSGDPAYPGGPIFNLLGLGKTGMDRFKVGEVKNGRLAMIAVAGFFLQSVLTGKGPWANLVDHVSSGGMVNLLSDFSPL